VRRTLVFAVAMLAVLAVLAWGAIAGAQEATPVVPPPSQCGIGPRAAAEVEALLAAATPAAGSTDAAMPFVLPAGTPADGPTVAAITATIREALACGNAGGALGALSLVTDAAIARDLAPPAEGVGLYVLTFGTAAPAADAWHTLLAVLDTRELEDGRVAALVIVGDPARSAARARLDYVLFAEQARGTGGSDQYLFLIDGWIADPYVLGPG